jgi:hypothetical protein
MVVRKNVLEYVISLAVAKNKVRIKKCLKQFKYDKVIQTNFGFIVCYDIDNVHIEVISIQKLINIDRRKLVEILLLILKEVIDMFIWTIELCHI